MAFWLMRWVLARQYRCGFVTIFHLLDLSCLTLFSCTIHFSILSFFQCHAATIMFSQLHLLLKQVMALIAYLMEFKGNYGPHLIIVPNAVLVNWKVPFLVMLYFEEFFVCCIFCDRKISLET